MVDRRVALPALNDCNLVRTTSNQREEHGTRNLNRLEQLQSLREAGCRLADVPQKVERWHAPLMRQGPHQVASVVEWPQQVGARAPQQRRLIDGCRKPTGREG